MQVISLLEDVYHNPQKMTTNEKVIAYCSQVLTPAEQNGSSCAKELNAVLYAIAYFYLYLANIRQVCLS